MTPPTEPAKTQAVFYAQCNSCGDQTEIEDQYDAPDLCESCFSDDISVRSKP